MNTLTSTKTKRASGIELLRILSLFFIILCHTLSSGETLTGLNKYLCVLVNSGFHAGMGVTCFMLITGYFGAHFSLKRFNKTYSIIYICSLAALTSSIIFSGFSAMTAVKSIIPVTSGKWWYASCYIYTLLISPFLDKLAEKISQKDFKRLLFILLTLFYFIPTFLYFDINSDKGKGLANMIIIYLLGRYLKLYPPKISTKKLWIALMCSMAVAFVGNCAVTVITHNIHWPFGRDCTVTTLVSSVSAFLIAQRCTFSSNAVNFVAKNSFYIYLLDFPRVIIQDYFNIARFENEIYYLPICCGIVLLSMAVSFGGSLILKYPAILIEKIMKFIEKSAGILLEKALPNRNNELSEFLKGDNCNG